MPLNLNNILALTAIFQSVLLSVFFFRNDKGNKLSNKILGAFLSVLAVTIIFSFTRQNSLGNTLIADKYQAFYLVVEFNYLLGPLLYFYVKSLVDKNFKIRPVYIIHFIPFLVLTGLVAFILIFWYFFYFPLSLQRFLVSIHFRELDMSMIVIHLMSYNIACLIPVVRIIKSDKPPSEALQVLWLKFLLPACTVLLMIKAFIYISILLYGVSDLMVYSNILYSILLFIFIYWISYYTLKNPETFSFSKKYQKSELKDSEIEELRKRVICFIEENKIYLEPSLTITQLSKKLSIPVPYLSRVINESFNLNFCDFINRYRIEESKQHLKSISTTKKTILEIAYTVGFNSKSSFYEAFKKQTGIIPTEFIKKSSAE